MLEHIIRQFDFHLEYARALVADLSEEQMTYTPAAGLDNHPAWTLGHLISGSAGLIEDMGGTFDMPEGWKELFLRKGPGDPRKPDPDTTKYPSKKALLDALDEKHMFVKEGMNILSEEELNTDFTWRFRMYMPTLMDLIIFTCITHEAMHLSQLAAWRRAMGLPSALSML